MSVAASTWMVGAATLAGSAADEFSDPKNEQTIYLMAGGLTLLGIGLIVATIWWWRTTRIEHTALAPLEVMSDRSWRSASWGDRRRRLESVRSASNGRPVVDDPHLQEIDLDALLSSMPVDFDDLRESPVSTEPSAAAAADEQVDETRDTHIDPLLRSDVVEGSDRG